MKLNPLQSEGGFETGIHRVTSQKLRAAGLKRGEPAFPARHQRCETGGAGFMEENQLGPKL